MLDAFLGTRREITPGTIRSSVAHWVSSGFSSLVEIPCITQEHPRKLVRGGDGTYRMYLDMYSEEGILVLACFPAHSKTPSHESPAEALLGV